MNLLQRLSSKGLIHPPKFLPDNLQYLVIMGSTAYGCNSEQSSDMDIYGFTVPPKEDVFPHLRGEIVGFGKQKNRFEVWQEHHVDDQEARRQYDFAIYSIVKFFHLCLENNPNMVDALFVPQRCVLVCTQMAQLVRENRKLFLHKGCWHKFKGYSYSSLKKINTKGRERYGKLKKFESEHGIPEGTTLIDIEKEIKRRKDCLA